MPRIRRSLAFALAALMAVVPAFATRTHKSTTASGHSRTSHKAKGRSHRLRGQQAIDSARATEIQQALIREHYLTGGASGQWDATTQAAMQKYQADHGWQTKLLPDSRALKALGLGPDYSTALNAKDSSFAAPPPAATIPTSQTAGFRAASGVATSSASASGVNH